MKNKKDLLPLNYNITEISTEDEKRNNLVSIPNQNTRYIYNSLTNSNNLELFKNRANKTSKGKAEYRVNGDNTAIIQKTANAEITLDLGGKISRPTKNIALWIFHKLGLQNITTNLFEDLSIEFPMQDLIDLGMYKELKNAYAGFNKAKNELTNIKLNAVVKNGKDKDLKKVTNDTTVMFIKAGYSNGTCYIMLNKYINWSVFSLQSYALIPKVYWKLSPKAQDLLYNIFSYARQQTGSHKANEITFNMSFRNIQNILSLPDETATNKPKQLIITPILEAIEECQKYVNENKEDFIIIPNYDKNGNIKAFLDGYLTVTLKGVYASKIIEIADNKSKIIQYEQAKKERIAEQAQAKVLASKIKKDKEKK